MNRERIQKWIIIIAAALGLIISSGGLAYRLFTNQTVTTKPSPKNTQQIQAKVTTPDNFYAKIKTGQPVQGLFLGEQSTRNQLFLDEFTRELDTAFSSKLTISQLSSLNGTSWSNLLALQKYENKEQPDLVLVCSGANDEKELSPDQYKNLSEATIQAIGKKYPHAEIMLVQEPSLNGVTVEIHRKLAQQYNLPMLIMKDSTKQSTPKVAYTDVIQAKLTTNASPARVTEIAPLWDIHKYQALQPIKTYSELYEMEQIPGEGAAVTLVGSKEGAFVESTFTGSGISLSVQCGPDRGVARVYIDGKKHNNLIDTYAPEPGVKHLLLADNLQSGEHRIKVIVLGYGKYPSSGTKVEIPGMAALE